MNELINWLEKNKFDFSYNTGENELRLYWRLYKDIDLSNLELEMQFIVSQTPKNFKVVSIVNLNGRIYDSNKKVYKHLTKIKERLLKIKQWETY